MGKQVINNFPKIYPRKALTIGRVNQPANFAPPES